MYDKLMNDPPQMDNVKAYLKDALKKYETLLIVWKTRYIQD